MKVDKTDLGRGSQELCSYSRESFLTVLPSNQIKPVLYQMCSTDGSVLSKLQHQLFTMMTMVEEDEWTI
jgi:hypothetical protein